MPFLRVIRDKRGYETTYLMHWFREGPRQHSRIIYVFRTPGGVRVGRPAMEADVLRDIERRYPDIDFDWHVVLENRQVVEVAPEIRRQRKRRRPEDDAGGVGGVPSPAPATAAAPALPPPKPRFVVPPKIEGDTPDAQIAFLSTWYVAIKEQVEQRASEPGRREALLALCARLNPANWTDADEITAGLPEAAEALERLSHVFAKRRRRSRKGKRGPAGEASGQAERAPGDALSDQPASDDASGADDDAAADGDDSGEPADE